MRLSIVNDQISLDLNTALEVIHEHQCKEMELRQIGFESIPDVDERWIALAEKAIGAKKLRVTSLHSDLFRVTAPGSEDISKILALGKRLRAQFIIVGGLQEQIGGAPGTSVPKTTDAEDVDEEDYEEESIALPPEGDLDAYRSFAAAAEREGLQVALTPDPESYAGTAEEALALVKAIGAKNLGLDWDVGNCFDSGDGSGLDALDDVLPLIKTLRVRDGVRRGMGADWVSIGKGVIPWEDIFEQLYEGGFRGPVILEPRVAPKLREARAALPLVARFGRGRGRIGEDDE
jgi:sugar phosphate isomerase/epimerase